MSEQPHLVTPVTSFGNSDEPQVEPPVPAVLLHSISRSYTVNGQQVMPLTNISLTITSGSFVALLGRSGSGKTTLLNLIGGLDQPSSGQAVVHGRSLAQLKERELTEFRRREVGFIFQSFALLPILTAAENVEVPLHIAGKLSPRERRNRVAEVLTFVGLTRWADHRPYELSGGQQQRVAIARAIAGQPRLLLADEPTGELDSKTSAVILRLLRQIVDQMGVTLLMATHDPSVEQVADTVYRIQDGTLQSS